MFGSTVFHFFSGLLVLYVIFGKYLRTLCNVQQSQMEVLLILKKCLYLLPVLFVNINSLRNYNVYPLESDRLCSLSFPFSPNAIEIGKDDRSAAIVEEKVYFDTLSGKYPFNCQFKVKTSEQDMGLFAVIQKMRLRKNKTSGECIDYVQFRHSQAFQLGPLNIELERNGQAQWGEKHCGNIVAKEVNFSSLNPTDQSRTLPHAHIDHKGKIDVRIHVSNESINYRGKDLELKIAFTSYLLCNRALGNSYKKCGGDACIYHKYFDDGILNCPFTTCLDENGCQLFYDVVAAGIKPSTGLATKVMVAAVAGVFTMFIVFVVFLWIFRHCSLCWSDSNSNIPGTTQMRPVPTVEDVQPSAPPRTPPIDKDLPPSYESLFPNTS